MARYRLKEQDGQGNKTGMHRVGNRRYRAGQTLESDQPLDKLFKNKFDRVEDTAPLSRPEIVRSFDRPSIPNPRAVVEPGVEKDNPSTPTRAKLGKSLHGVDVTDEFRNAELLAMKVYHDLKKDMYRVLDNNSGEVLKTAKSEKAVQKFLKDQIG